MNTKKKTQQEIIPSGRVEFPIVGIGASAGGLNAFKTFFTAMPADSGMAFVLVQHLDPTHESLTADLLARHTAMQVIEVQDRMPVEPDHVYMIPPNKYLTIHDSLLHLSEPVLYRGMRMPIDYFFRSLAEVQEERAIGIVLSGAGTDGTLGLKAIKGGGGVILVQSPETAQYDGMPGSAVATGQVDYVVPIEDMPEILTQYVKHAFTRFGREPAILAMEKTDLLRSILAVLRTRTRYDFRYYKKGTIMRRIGRRMGLNRVAELGDYLDFLRDDPDEATRLFKDLLIGVTGFFREAEAFRQLEKLIAKIVQEKSTDTPIRIWVPGCATGEEPYSIAMLVFEQLRRAQKNCPLQLFATDIDEDALATARAGLYPENIAADVSPENLQRFFRKEENAFRVNKPVRDSVVFAVQNLIADPPFSKLDLVSCRNLLIYLEPDIQKKVIQLFHFALNEGGYLFLGSAEAIGQQENLFATVDKKWRLFRRLGAVRRDIVEFPIFPEKHISGEARGAATPSLADSAQLGKFVHSLLLERFVPAAVLVDRKYQILYYHGPIGSYLQQPSGTPTEDLLTRTREEYRHRLRTLLHKSTQGDGSPQTGIVRPRQEGSTRRVRITVDPARSPAGSDGLLLVSFQEEPAATQAEDTGESTASEKTLVQQLEYELKASRDELQSSIEQMESANEELKAANEEVMSVNEELQSTNEELETSKEELQSLNEELTTVNSQLEEKIGELEETNDDLDNLLSSTDIATIFLDTEFRIKRFTPATGRLFSMIATDVGRPISDISRKFHDADLLTDAAAVLDRLTSIEKQVRADDDHWYSRHILPYRTQNNRIEGVVITFVDISERRRAEQLFRLVVEAAPDAAVVVNQAGEIELINARTEAIFGYTRQELIGQPVEILVPEQLQAQHRVHRREFIEHPEVRYLGSERELFARRKDGSEFPVEIGLNPIKMAEGTTLVLGTVLDITDRKRAAENMQKLKEEAEQANQAKTRFLTAASHDLRQPLQTLMLLNGVLANKIKDPEALAFIQNQLQSLTTMGDLLNVLLNLSMLEAGVIETRINDIGVMQILDRMKGEFELQACVKGLELHIVPCSMSIHTDPTLLCRILQNFVANAIRYTDSGKVLIGCRRRGGGLRIEVWDTGIGIRDEHLDSIFQEFVQLDNPAREQHKGQGLGLSVAHYLARLLGYKLDARSSPGKCSMFAVEVPMASKGYLPVPDAAGTGTTCYEGRRDALVLLVEDDLAVLDATRLLLESQGLQVVTATSGAEALALLHSSAIQPDVVIADQRLPGSQTGIELIARIRKETKQEIPAVIITGDILPQAIQELAGSGCRVFYKPINSDALIAAMNELIGN